MYQLSKTNSPDFKKTIKKLLKNRMVAGAVLAVIFVILVFYYLEVFAVGYLHNKVDGLLKETAYVFSEFRKEYLVVTPKPSVKYVSQISYEQSIIDAVASASPSVVSIVISKNLPVYQQRLINPFGENSPFEVLVPEQVQKGTKYQEVGAGSGFIVSPDGLVLTNKHVVSDKTADYTVLTNDGKKYQAKVLALDPVLDLAVIKIQAQDSKNPEIEVKFKPIKIGDSAGIAIGQGAIAIGNSLGQFSNTVSVGVISGLGRTITASGSQGFTETLEGIIQTDAAINHGNSGGPLLNLKGEVIGINTAMATGADSVGFAIPINSAKRDIDQIIKTSKIIYPFLGVRYILVDQKVKDKYKLSVEYGALALRGENGEPAIAKDSSAQKAGIKEKDIILEINGEKIVTGNSMAKIIQKYNPADKITIKILRSEKEIELEAVLGERS